MSRLGRAEGQRPARARREARIDPVCHTLVGAGLARSGLGRRTTLGTATLLIGANLPDIDVLAYLDGPAADLAFRRGWTHGVLALVGLPFLLTGMMLLADRLHRRVRPAAGSPPTLPRELLLLAAVSIVSHPALDTLNTYGVRWLMPFDGRWFYGDVLFIVDPWLWLALGVGLVASRVRRSTGPARLALLVLVAYAGAMAVSGLVARRIAAAELARRTGRPVERLMLAPLPLTPFRRTVVAAQGEEYLVGRFRWLDTPRLEPGSVRSFPRLPPAHPAVEAAAATTVGRRFLGWARFPSFAVERVGPREVVVHIVDLRYADRPGVSFGSVSIPVPPPPAEVADRPEAPGRR